MVFLIKHFDYNFSKQKFLQIHFQPNLCFDQKINFLSKTDFSKHSHNVRQVLSVERLSKSSKFVASCGQQMKQRNHSTLKLGTSSSVDSGWAERLPDDRLADVGSDKQRDTRTKSVALLEKLVEQENDESGDK